MTTNVFSRLAALLPPSPLLLARVIEVHTDDTSTVELPVSTGDVQLAAGLAQGKQLRVRGSQVPAGANAFVRDGLIESRAPDGDPVLVVIGRVAPTPNGPKLLARNGTIPNQNLTIGVPYTLEMANFWKDGFPPNTYQYSGALPPGLTFNSATARVAGTPTTAGVSTMTPAATDTTERRVAQTAVTFTVAAATCRSDPYAANRVALLQPNGAINSQNLAFWGAAGTSLSVTGSTAKIVASPDNRFAKLWRGATSNYVKLTLGSHGVMPGDFTFQAWFHQTNNNTFMMVGGSSTIYIYNNSVQNVVGGNIAVPSYHSGGEVLRHLVIQRIGSELVTAVDGARHAVTTNSNPFDISEMHFGMYIPNFNLWFDGLLGEVVVHRGAGVYPSLHTGVFNYDVPTLPMCPPV